MPYSTLSFRNQAKIVCPVFDAETKVAACVKLRNAVWQGKRPDVRRGCQACMSAGKCPVAVIVQRLAMSNSAQEDAYASDEPKVMKLGADVLDRISRTVVSEKTIAFYRASPVERDLILSADERIHKQLGTAPATQKAARSSTRVQGAGARVSRKGVTQTRAPETPKTDSALSRAAATGDLSAAINSQE